MRSKNATIRELLADIRTAAQQEQYNPAEDLKTCLLYTSDAADEL